ncbi:hypothetical protein [Effusibacillus dendaii]|uniref:Uncharacterized protein n=1 Tax=Effusibacillus dendaii TaxID=2743772 RepID=A0A7I8DBT9_9BACL|nr:hypothetical protein [Effusibacillus dendaii]BCJ86802.1 hypothetical protein skT53_17870 [Effusibacillus dendaii]
MPMDLFRNVHFTIDYPLSILGKKLILEKKTQKLTMVGNAKTCAVSRIYNTTAVGSKIRPELKGTERETWSVARLLCYHYKKEI